MSPNKNKVKGSTWEREAVELLNTKLKKGKFKRIPSSGAIGTLMGESLLTGDISGDIKGIPKKIKAECKVGYSNKTDAPAKSLTVQKEWLDKIKQEAEVAYAVPALLCKFSNARSGVKNFVALDFETFSYLINIITDLAEELDKVYGVE